MNDSIKNTGYDVFISCKHEDYETAEGIYSFLTQNGIKTFLASESLRRLGNTAYLDEIDVALESCKHMIVFTTRSEYAGSTFVKEEWQTFRNEKLSGRKDGNLMTIVGHGLTIKDLPLGLRRYEVIPYDSYKTVILDYLIGCSIPNKPIAGAFGTSKERMVNDDEVKPKAVEAERLRHEQTETEKSKLTFDVKGVRFDMIKILGGTFTMGATSEQGSDAWDDEKPTHQVTLSDYYIGQTEVTQGLWQAVMGSNPSQYEKGDSYPVQTVSWEDCQTFISKLNSMLSSELGSKRFALPTEAQWEYAARGGNKSKGYKYSGSNRLSDVAWYDDNSGSVTHPVGTKQANELGLYDMSGNVWEWCQDWKGSYSSSAQTNPTGPDSGSNRVFRGGGWDSSARRCRVSNRFNCSPTIRDFDLGLRLVLYP